MDLGLCVEHGIQVVDRGPLYMQKNARVPRCGSKYKQSQSRSISPEPMNGGSLANRSCRCTFSPFFFVVSRIAKSVYPYRFLPWRAVSTPAACCCCCCC